MLLFFSENQKKILLENTIASFEPLRAAKYQADQLHTHIVKELDCDQHDALLFSATTKYDAHFASASTLEAREKFASLN